MDSHIDMISEQAAPCETPVGPGASIDAYLDSAIRRQQLSSDRELARRLGFTSNPVTAYRTRRAWPDDHTMLRLARLGGHNEARALLHLNMWRSDLAEVRAIYMTLADRIAAS
jgi:hypothetical protein